VATTKVQREVAANKCCQKKDDEDQSSRVNFDDDKSKSKNLK